ncbi:uncharacterized protein LOC127007040 isoform X2 [Eriocheir sinensis]|uniref:uncharacterized protein LOC127007040 isoform X2 n=1 Tax=Eriocheir sinensis TaxID=95602 RepID=UPI0021CAB5A2|nr:uncharacterized protein LOC127007040 isoform X2 [Eriocheir sinensis]
MGRTLCLLVLCAVVLRVQSWPGDGDLGTDSDHEETNWRTETGNTEGAAATDEERRDKRQDSSEGDATSLKHLAIEKALTARKIPPTHNDVPLRCDELITNEEFYIHSPGYPANYPGNTSCQYQIFKRHENVCGVVFTVLRLDLATPYGVALLDNLLEGGGGAAGDGEKAACPGDSLIINDVLYCGRYQRGKTATFTFTTKPLMTVEFRSRPGHGASGFLLQGRQVTTCRHPRSLGPPLVSSAPCNRRLIGESFVVRSPGYPRQYSHNLECRYTVMRASPDVCELQLVMQGFSVEDGSCMFDYLEVQGQRLCGSLPAGFTRHFDFEGDELHIRFRSDESTKRSGFVISGQQVPCSERPVQAPLSQSLPDKSNNKTLSTTQPKSIQTSPTSRPSTSISLSGNQSNDNINFILSLLNRQPTQTTRREGPEGRNMSEEDFTELDPGLVTFREADDEHTNADQNIPGSPNFNPFTGSGLTPTIPTLPTDFPTFPTNFPSTPTNIPTNPTVFPTNPTVFPTNPTVFPANPTVFPTNPTIFSTNPTNFPTIPTDFPTTFDVGLTPTFPSVTRIDCDQLITTPTAEIQSPSYPSEYPNSTDCSYTMGRADTNTCLLEVTFVDVDLPFLDPVTSQCNADYLEVGGTKFCGTFQNRVVTIPFTGQTATLSFHSDAAESGRGFKISVAQLSTNCLGPVLPPISPGECDTTVTLPQFRLNSPSYPVRYPPSTDCTTTVLRSSADITSLFLDLVDFELGTTLGCTGDYLEVGGERLCGVLTGQTRTVPFVGNSVVIRFHSGADVSIGGRGYSIRVLQTNSSVIPGGCGGFVTTPTAALQSPNYPNSYPPNSNCRYVVNKVSGDICQLHIKVLDMDIEYGVGCARDYLQIGVQERLCGRRIPGEIRKYHFTGRQLNILFHSDVFGSGRGFSIEVTQISCGHFRPMYPYRPTYRPHHHYPHSHHHHHQNHRPNKPQYSHHRPWWNTRPKYPNHQYSSAYTQQTTPCPYFPVSPQWQTTTPFPPTTTSPPTFPPPTLPPVTPTPTIPTVTPVRLIPRPAPQINASSLNIPTTTSSILSSVSNVTNRGADREAKRTLGAPHRDRPCHQVVNTEEFTLQSPGFPAPYYANSRCFYSIVRQSGSTCGVELVVEEFDVEKSPGCANAYLFLAKQRYCGSIDQGAQSLVPFSGREPIVLIFVGGQFSSGAGFRIRGRQIPCAKAEETVPRLTEAVEQQRQPQLSRGQKSRNKRVTLRGTGETEAEWLNLRVGGEDMVLDWVGPGGRSGDQLTHR